MRKIATHIGQAHPPPPSAELRRLYDVDKKGGGSIASQTKRGRSRSVNDRDKATVLFV